MEKNKVLLTDKVTKENLKSPTFKKWVMRVLCFACILSLALQLTLCCIPIQASAQEDDSIVGTWVINETPNFLSTTLNVYLDGFMYGRTSQSNSTLIKVDLKFLQITNERVVFGSVSTFSSSYYPYYSNDYLVSTGWRTSYQNYGAGTYYPSDDILARTIIIETEPTDETFITWLKANAEKQVTQVYDFIGEYRLFNEQLTNLSFSQAGTVTQSYSFDFNIWGGYNADYFHVQADGTSVDISYAFTDEGSGGVTTVYRQLLRNGQIVGTWLVPRARLIYFESNPDDTTFQQWLLDNTTLVDESMLETVYDFGYNNGFNDGWTNNVIGDTLKAPIDALNGMVLLQTADVTITLGGVIFTMIVLSLLIVFLKKYAGG